MFRQKNSQFMDDFTIRQIPSRNPNIVGSSVLEDEALVGKADQQLARARDEPRGVHNRLYRTIFDLPQIDHTYKQEPVQPIEKNNDNLIRADHLAYSAELEAGDRDIKRLVAANRYLQDGNIELAELVLDRKLSQDEIGNLRVNIDEYQRKELLPYIKSWSGPDKYVRFDPKDISLSKEYLNPIVDAVMRRVAPGGGGGGGGYPPPPPPPPSGSSGELPEPLPSGELPPPPPSEESGFDMKEPPFYSRPESSYVDPFNWNDVKIKGDFTPVEIAEFNKHKIYPDAILRPRALKKDKVLIPLATVMGLDLAGVSSREAIAEVIIRNIIPRFLKIYPKNPKLREQARLRGIPLPPIPASDASAPSRRVRAPIADPGDDFPISRITVVPRDSSSRPADYLPRPGDDEKKEDGKQLGEGVKKKKKPLFALNSKRLKDRISVIIGEMKAGNDSSKMKQELSQSLDAGIDLGVVSKKMRTMLTKKYISKR